MVRPNDTPETRSALRLELRMQRDRMAPLADTLLSINPEAAQDIERARSALFAAWSKLSEPPMIT